MEARKEVVHSPEAPKGRGPFPQAIRLGSLLMVSGQGPLDPLRNEPDTGSFEHEVDLALRNLRSIVRATGADFKDALKLTVYLTDLANVPKFNEIYASHFPEPRPARTVVQVGLRGIQVEIDGFFQIPEQAERTAG